ncbi:zinc ribbon domain-containing protein [Halobacterium jilantaiense]|uniref:DUF7575 domain-containing protein n=1 Tax=Halobacterium jilantaiense TaxID=355548 RepID=A0A1I0N9M8_9EURY|nr:zinc ribbon domain-containing protein [Halobacterium jilantaiense]SEV97929.1 hypothetical protein SAMN04487945_0706 [Halobacterium jilantaiense]
MNRTLSQKRPWLAALLSVLATGLGHLYLRRWRRALGWLAVVLGVSYFLVDPAALDAAASGEAFDLVELLPVLVVTSLSVADAYLLAYVHNAVAKATVTPDGELSHCPNCGKEVDTDLEFCHWCTAELPDEDAHAAPQLDDESR